MNFRNLALVAVIILTACSSNDDDPKTTGGSITLTGVTGASDKYVYIDDELSITGTGFDPNTEKDSVELMVTDTFGDFQTINYQGSGHYFVNQIVSAGSIKFKVPDDQLTWFNSQVYQSNYQYGFRVRSNGQVSNIIEIPVRRIFSFNFTHGSVNTAIMAGNPVSIDGKYFTDNCSMKISLTRCGKPTECAVGDYSLCDCDTFVSVPCSGWSYNNEAEDGTYVNMVTSFPLQSVFGITTQECEENVHYYQTKVRIENKDGKVAIGYCWIYYRPC